MYSERVIHKFNPKSKPSAKVSNSVSSGDKSPDPYYILRGHTSFINSIVFDKWNPSILYSGSGDGELRIWNIEEKKCIETHQAHKENRGILSLHSISSSDEPSTPMLISQGRDGTIKIWKSTESTLVHIDTIETDSISLGKCSVTSKTLAISSDESPSIVDLWDLKSKQIALKFKSGEKVDEYGISMSLKSVVDPSTSQLLLYSGYENGSLVMWDSRQPDKPLLHSKLHNDPILAFDISSNNTSGISGGGDSNIIEFSINNGQIEIQNKHQLNNNGISEIKIRNDEKIFATAGWDHRIRIFNVKKHTPLAILKYHEESVFTLDFNSNNVLASASKDMRIALWSIYNK